MFEIELQALAFEFAKIASFIKIRFFDFEIIELPFILHWLVLQTVLIGS